jgi:putative solute:sodium symporter small subunit
VGAQGGPLTFVLLIGFYAWYMNRLDQEHNVSEED